MRKMIIGSVAVAAICIWAQPDRVRSRGNAAADAGLANRAETLETAANAGRATACHDIPGYYVNADGRRVYKECVTEHQSGETAICRDGSHSFSIHHNGTCLHHGGVAHRD
jgi:hypothetical protein